MSEILLLMLGENAAKFFLKYRGYIIIFLVLVVGYFIAKKLGMSIFTGKSEEKDALNTLAQQGEKPTFAKTDFAEMADEYHKNVQGANEDEAKMAAVLLKMKNTADILTLIEAFGTRDVSPWWKPKNEMTLPASFVEFGEEYIQIVNDDYKAKGIKLRFSVGGAGYVMDIAKNSNPDDLDNDPDVLSIPKVTVPVAKYFYLAKKALY